MGSSGRGGGGGIILGGKSVRPIPITGTLTQWESPTRRGVDQNREFAAFFDSDGNPVIGFEGSRHSVAVNPRYLDVEGGVMTHNHPDNDFGGTLSMQDLKVFAKSKLSELRAHSEQGQLYSVKASENADRAGLLKWVNTNQKLMQQNFERSYDSAYKQATTPLKSGAHKGQIKLTNRRTGKVIYRQPMTPAQATRYARQYSVGQFDRTYKKNLAKFGITYTSTKAGKNQ